jgi:3',5'-cyclic AMP phosphodiesterase CpdA
MRPSVLAAAALIGAGILFARPSAQTQPTAPTGPGAPGGTFGYAIDDERVRAIEPPARPLPAESETAKIRKFSFFVYGDTRSGTAQRGQPPPDGQIVQINHSAVVEQMIAKAHALASTAFPVRFVVSSGDGVLYGPNGRMWNVSYIPVVERLTRDAGLPFFFAPGNHDVTVRPAGDPSRERGLRNTLDAMARLMPPEGSPRRLDGYATFSFGYGNSFFILLDSNIARDEKQFAWVTRQLETLDRSRYRNVFAVFHHPVFSSGQHGGPTFEIPSAVMRELYMPLFRRHHVRMTLAGHDHLLDHFVERYEDHGKTYRMDHLVSAGGGAPTYVYTGEPDLRAYLDANASEHVRVEHLIRPGPTVADNPHHFVVVRVDGEKISLEVVAGPPVPYRPYGRARVELKR